MSTTPPGPGFEFKLADGSVVKAENIEEAFKTVAKMKEDTAAALKEARAGQEQLKSQIDALQAEVQARTTPPPREGEFNRDHYFRLVGEDPVMAQNYLDAYRFGIPDPAQVPTYFQNMDTRLSNLDQQTLAASFVNLHPDFPADVTNAEILTKEVIRLRNSGHPVNMDTMELAWQNCVSSEAIKPMEESEEETELPPSLGGSGAQTVDAETARIESDVLTGKMSIADFEKYLQSKGMLR